MDDQVEQLIQRIRQSISQGMSKEAIIGHYVDVTADEPATHEDVFLAYMAAQILLSDVE